MHRRLVALVAAALALAPLTLPAAPADAITYGQPDGTAHPYVGLLVTRDSDGFARCTGSLVSSTVLVTAGHCTAGITEPVQVWFEPGPIEPDPAYLGDGNCDGVAGYPCRGDAAGTAYTYPDFDPGAPQTADLGVVVLDRPWPLEAYAELPQQDQLDALKPSANTTFTAVGYGLQQASKNGRKDVAIRERMTSQPKLAKIGDKSTGDYSFLVSQNAATGGVCIGDSGAPMLLDGSPVLTGVVSYVTNDNCKGQAGVFRLDRSGPLRWLAGFLGG